MRHEISFIISKNYGWVILIAALHVFVLQFLANMVMKARKRYGVEYPNMYAVKGISRSPPIDDESLSTPLLTLSDADCDAFNCYQRAHENALESTPQFYLLLLITGLRFPLTATLCGLIYVAGRIVYAYGYYTGKPQNRHWGSFGHLGLLILWLLATYMGMSLICSSTI